MRPKNAVLVHHDPALARALAESLQSRFRKIAMVTSFSEAKDAIARRRAVFAIVDLELLTYDELRKLCSAFPGTSFVSVHRLADEIMWTESLATGAVDCCLSSDLRGILMASERSVSSRRTMGAVA